MKSTVRGSGKQLGVMGMGRKLPTTLQERGLAHPSRTQCVSRQCLSFAEFRLGIGTGQRAELLVVFHPPSAASARFQVTGKMNWMCVVYVFVFKFGVEVAHLLKIVMESPASSLSKDHIFHVTSKGKIIQVAV